MKYLARLKLAGSGAAHHLHRLSKDKGLDHFLGLEPVNVQWLAWRHQRGSFGKIIVPPCNELISQYMGQG